MLAQNRVTRNPQGYFDGERSANNHHQFVEAGTQTMIAELPHCATAFGAWLRQEPPHEGEPNKEIAADIVADGTPMFPCCSPW